MKQAERAGEAIARELGMPEIARGRDPIEVLRDSAAYLQLVMRATGLGIWDFHPRTGALHWSERCKALFGLPPDAEVSYAIFLEKVHPDDRARCDAAVRSALDTENDGRDFALEYRVGRGSEGSERWLGARGRAFFADGRAVRFLGAVLDITERKTAEHRLERLKDALEQRMGERASELAAAHELLRAEIAERLAAEQRLRQAQKMEAIGELTGGIAHDFNNLLTVIQGNLELLRDRHVPSPGHRLLDAAARAAERGADLTQKLLAFARRQRLAPRPVDIARLLDGMAEFLRRAIGEAITIEVAVTQGLWLAMVDPGQIEHAIVNLALNGRDAMPLGGRLVLTAVNAGDGGALPEDLVSGDYVVIAVRDTGIGMDERVLERACDPFFTTKEVGKGTGLGLSQVHGIAKQSGGTVRLTSSLGAGTTAELFLPRADIPLE